GAQHTADAPRPADGGAPAPVADTDGDVELARPAAPATDADGDYALSDPLSPRREQTVPTAGGRGGTPPAPAVPRPARGPAGPATPATAAGGDYAPSDPLSPGREQPAPTAGGTDGTCHAPAVPGPSGERAGPAMSEVSGPGPEQSVPTQGTEPHRAPGAGTGTGGGTDGTLHAPAVPGPSGEPASPAAADVSGPGPEQTVPT